MLAISYPYLEYWKNWNIGRFPFTWQHACEHLFLSWRLLLLAFLIYKKKTIG